MRPILLAAIVALACSASPALADTVYWSNSAGNTISSTAGDLSTTGATVDGPRGVAIDLAANRIYWANQAGNKISFANLDGSGGGDLNTSGATVSAPDGVAIDPSAGRIYWANSEASKISFANLSGSGGSDLSTSGATVSAPRGVAVYAAANRIYWANSGANKISFARLDGGGGGDLATTGATVNAPMGVAVDVVTARVYWANNGGDKISSARIDGSGNGADLAITGATVDGPEGVALDPIVGRIYWANENANQLSSATLTGSGGGGVSAAAGTLDGPTFPVLALVPSGIGVPTISVIPTGPSGRELECSQGAWAPDLPSSFLFRAPRTLAFQWTGDGVPIPGATSADFATADFNPRQTYRCAVTASNAAGSTTQTSAGVTQGSVHTPPAKATFTGTRSRIHVSARRRFSFTLNAGGALNGFALFKRAHVRKDFTVPPSGIVTLRVRLSAKTYRTLKRHHRIRIRVTATLHGDFGLTSTAGKSFTLYA